MPGVVGEVQSESYIVHDNFITALTAGNVNSTLAEPGPGGERYVTDTGNLVTVSGGYLRIGGKGTVADPQVIYKDKIVTRQPGRLIFHYLNTAGNSWAFGMVVNTSPNWVAFADLDLGGYQDSSGNFSVKGGTIVESSLPYNTTYFFCYALRTNGYQLFINKAGTWYLDFVSNSGNTTNLYLAVMNYSSPSKVAQFKFRSAAQLYLAIPMVSDGFSILNTTDGLGHAEGVAGTVGAGGSSKTWTYPLGTWDITTTPGKFTCGTLDGSGIGIAVVDSGKTDVYASLDLNRTGNEVGLIVNYANADNYIRAIHDGTNAKLIKRVATVETTVITAVAAYSANATMTVRSIGTSYYLFYNNVLIGSGTISDAALRAATKVGVYTTNAANYVDNLRVWATGTSSEYNIFNRYSQNPSIYG